MRDLLKKLGFSTAAIQLIAWLLFLWVLAIILSGGGWNPLDIPWDFSNSGAFGDSFAPLSALMALVAAIGAIGAYKIQSDEINRIRDRQTEQDRILQSDRARTISREENLDKQNEIQLFEATFFQLLRSHRDLVNSLDLVHRESRERTEGHDVFRTMLGEFKRLVGGNNRVQNVKVLWKDFSDTFRNDINHYFRLLYHIVRFIDAAKIDNRYFYVQILRASLSDAELTFLALNCDYGEGREKFKILVERYSLLHNLSDNEVRFWKLRLKFEPNAFDSTPAQTEFPSYEPFRS